MAHAGNTNICRIWAKIISTYAKKCSISVEGRRGEERGGEGRGQKTKVYDLSGHECIRQCSDDGKALKYCPQYPGVMQESQEGKRADLWGPRAHFGANIPMKITRHWNFPEYCSRRSSEDAKHCCNRLFSSTQTRPLLFVITDPSSPFTIVTASWVIRTRWWENTVCMGIQSQLILAN